MVFDSQGVGIYNGSYFGLDSTLSESELVLCSIPWDATVSYREGTSAAPQAIIEASTQVELLDAHYGEQWQRGIFTVPVDKEISVRNKQAREAACRVIEHIEAGGDQNDMASELQEVNSASEWLNQRVFEQCRGLIEAGKIVGLVGGDHSTPLGLIKALGQKHSGFGILHIDAHMDLRDGYEGFEFSHASIMRRALECDGVAKLVQVGVRDFCADEWSFGKGDSRVEQFLDVELFESKARGVNWHEQCEKIIAHLPQQVYVSFDIDGLQRSYCPSTGTPVPGGLDYNEAVYLLHTLTNSGRQVVGFDLNEVCPNPDDEWDAIVGARMLYKLANVTLYNN